MEFLNQLYERFNSDSWYTETYQQALETLLLVMAPITPFISEELWQQTGHQESIHLQEWPTWDPEIEKDRVIQIPVQINGIKRAVIEVEVPAKKTEVEKAAFKSVKVQQHISGQIVKDMIYIPGKILNIRTETHP